MCMFAAFRTTVRSFGFSLNSSLSPGFKFKKFRTSRGMVVWPLLVTVAVGIYSTPVNSRTALHFITCKEPGKEPKVLESANIKLAEHRAFKSGGASIGLPFRVWNGRRTHGGGPKTGRSYTHYVNSGVVAQRGSTEKLASCISKFRKQHSDSSLKFKKPESNITKFLGTPDPDALATGLAVAPWSSHHSFD